MNLLTADHSPLNTLCIDTVSSVAGITMVTPNLSYHSPINPQMASEGIIERIDETLKKANINLSDLTAILVIKGPGSFTGLRVGISVANQFSHQLKIPILGLRTDEWWHLRSTETNKLYIQSMNKQEVYVSDERNSSIIPTENLSEFGLKKWLGELKFDHSEKLPKDFQEIEVLDAIEKTWERALIKYENELKFQKIYELVEPFYGKEPNITLPKAKK